MSDEGSGVRGLGGAAKRGKRTGQKLAPPVSAFPRHTSPVAGHSLVRLARYLLPLWPKLLAGVLCLITVSLLSLYSGVLGKNLVQSIKDENRDLLNHYALTAVFVFLAKGVFAYGQ